MITMAKDIVKEACRILADECKTACIPAMALHDVADHIFDEVHTRCSNNVPIDRLVALRVAGLVIRELARHQGDRAEEMPLVECPKCGNAKEFSGYLAVSINIDREGGRYVAAWNEGLDFEATCAQCGVVLDGELSGQLYGDMDIDL